MAFNKLITVLFIIGANPGYANFRHTGVGNGGDVMQAYLEETRVRLINVLSLFLRSKLDIQTKACASESITIEQQRDCEHFLGAVGNEMIAFNRTANKIPLILSAEPLYAPGPDGTMQRVAAITDLGAAGGVTFDYVLVSGRTPEKMLALLFHEMGHKITFAHGTEQTPRYHIEDNHPVLSFSSGRAMLDHIGMAVATFARNNGIIRDSFRLIDTFSCTVRLKGGPTFRVNQSDARNFLNAAADTHRFDAFDIGLNRSKGNDIRMDETNSCLSFQINLTERHNCDSKRPDGRSTTVSLYRYFRNVGDEDAQPPKLIMTELKPGWNPVCEEDQALREKPLTLNHDDISFTCVYKGAQGDAGGPEPSSALKGFCD